MRTPAKLIAATRCIDTRPRVGRAAKLLGEQSNQNGGSDQNSSGSDDNTTTTTSTNGS